MALEVGQDKTERLEQEDDVTAKQVFGLLQSMNKQLIELHEEVKQNSKRTARLEAKTSDHQNNQDTPTEEEKQNIALLRGNQKESSRQDQAGDHLGESLQPYTFSLPSGFNLYNKQYSNLLFENQKSQNNTIPAIEAENNKQQPEKGKYVNITPTDPKQGISHSPIIYPILAPEHLQAYSNLLEESRYYKVNIKEYDPKQHIQEWVSSISPIIRTKTNEYQKQKLYLVNHLPASYQTQILAEAQDSNISFEKLCDLLFLKFGVPQDTLLNVFLNTQLKDDNVKEYVEQMINNGRAVQMDDQAVICLIRCRLPEYINKFLKTRYSNLYEFKDAVFSSVYNPNVEMYKNYLQQKARWEKKQDYNKKDENRFHGKKDDFKNKGRDNKEYKGKKQDLAKTEQADHVQGGKNIEGQAGVSELNQGSPNTQEGFEKEQETEQQISEQLKTYQNYLNWAAQATGQQQNSEDNSGNAGTAALLEVECSLPEDTGIEEVRVFQGQPEPMDTYIINALKSSEYFQEFTPQEIEAFVESAKKRKADEVPTTKREQSTQIAPQQILNRALQKGSSPTQLERKALQNILQTIKNQDLQSKNKQFILDPSIVCNEAGDLNIENILRQLLLPIPTLTALRLLNSNNSGQVISNLFQQILQSFQNTPPVTLLQNTPQTQQAQGNVGQQAANDTQYQSTQNTRANTGSNQTGASRQQQAQLSEPISLEAVQTKYGVNPFSKMSIEQQNVFVQKYQKQITEPRNKLFLAPVNLGVLGKYTSGIYGIVDTRCTNSLLTLKSVEKFRLLEDMIPIKPEHQLNIRGVGGKSRIIGIIPNFILVLGESPVFTTIGVVENEEFDILIGNDITRELKLSIDTKARNGTYKHPTKGLQKVDFISSSELSESSARLAIFDEISKNSNIPESIQKQVAEINNQTFLEELKANSNGEMVDQYLQEFEEFTAKGGQNIKPRQFSAIKDFCMQDTIQQQIKSQELYPQLQEAIEKQEPKYDLLLVDPPWKHKPYHHSRVPYPQQGFNDLLYLPIKELRNEDSVCLLWTTGSHIFQALHLLNVWDYKYINILIVWHKIRKDGLTNGKTMGWWSRANCEYLLLGTSGHVSQFRSANKHVNQFIETTLVDERVGIHSAKPTQIYAILDDIFNTKEMRKLELFARERNEGNADFDIYGDQLEPHFQLKIGIEFEEPFVEGLTVALQKHMELSLQDTIEQKIGHLESTQQAQVMQLMQQNQEVFQIKPVNPDRASNVKFHLKPGIQPIQKKTKVFNERCVQFLDKEISRLLKLGILKVSDSLYNVSPTIAEKANGDLRFTLNLIPVNEQFELTIYPATVIDLVYPRAKGKQYLSVFDLKDAFWQVVLPVEYRKYFAFSLAQGKMKGHYEFTVLPQGFKNSMAVFQKEIDEILADLYSEGVGAYVDDVYVFSDTFEFHVSTIQKLLVRLQSRGMSISPKKCQLFQSTVDLLGFKVGKDCITPQPKKIKAIMDLRVPQTFQEVQKMMGSLNYYRKFIGNLSVIMRALSSCLRQNEFRWTDTQQKAFDLAKKILSFHISISLMDENLPLMLAVNFTANTFACCLYQSKGDQLKILGFASSIQSDSQKRMVYSERVYASALWSMQQFECLLYKPFIVQMINRSLLKVNQLHNPSSRIAMWQISFQTYQFEVQQVGQRLLNMLSMFLYLIPQLEQNIMEQQYEELDNQVSKQELRENEMQDTEMDDKQYYQYICKFDGGCQHKCVSYAFIIMNENSEILHQESGKALGETNNSAEYTAVLNLLKCLASKRISKGTPILIQGDSQLVIKQLKGQYQCQSRQLQVLYSQCQRYIRRFSQLEFQYIKREFNQQCDSLCQEVFQQEQNERPTALFQNTLTQEIEKISCQVCRHTEGESHMLLCDNCALGYHLSCIKLKRIPNGNFFCSGCEQNILYKNITSQPLDPTQDYDLISFLQGRASNPSEATKHQAQQYIYDQGHLFRKTQKGPRLVPQVGEREMLIKHFHFIGGHCSVKRTLQLIAQYYYWPRMTKQIPRILQRCVICQADRAKFYNPPLHQPLKKGYRPFLVMHVDLFKLPRTKEGDQAVMLVVDGFSKWIEAHLLQDSKAETVWKSFQNNVIYRYSCPEVVITDNGPEFQGVFHFCLLQREIKHTYTSPLHPQANGQVERYVAIIKTAIRRLLHEGNEEQWVDLIQQASFAMRILQSRSTSLSPYEVVFGSKPQLPGFLTQKLNQKDLDNFSDQDIIDHVQWLQRKRHTQPVQQHLQKMEEEILKTMGQRQKVGLTDLQFGDIVLIKNYKNSPLDLRSTGPGMFLEFTNSNKNAAIIYNTNTRRVHRCNVTNLAPFQPC